MSTILVAMPAAAQHSTSPADVGPPKEVAQLDFFVGDWDLVAKPIATTLAQKIHGVRALQGTWKVWREFDGRGVEDDLRLTDVAGNPRVILHSMRAYDPAKRQWIVTALDPFRPAVSQSTAEWTNGQMIVSGSGTDSDGKAYISRSRYTDITPTSFKFSQERSTDAGKTWTATGVKIEAKRAPAKPKK